MNVCKRCGCHRGPHAEGDECTNRGWCELVAASWLSATEEDRLIADALAELSRLDDVRKARAAR